MEIPLLENFGALLQRGRSLGPKKCVVAAAEDPVILNAVAEASLAGLVIPILIGDPTNIASAMTSTDSRTTDILRNATIVETSNVEESAEVAVRIAAEGKADMILKGHLRTDQLLHAVLDKQQGLSRKGLLSDVLIYEDTLGARRRLVGITDGGVNVAPSLEQKKEILKNAVFAFHRLGFRSPRVAVMSAIEIVSKGIQSTVDADKLSEMARAGEFGECEVFGPLALDNALIESCARAKGIHSPVAGYADIMLAANIEAGNILGKSVKYFGGSAVGHVIVGSKVPILIPSRVESVQDKLNSIAFGVVCYE